MATKERQKIWTDEETKRMREKEKRDITPRNMQPERPTALDESTQRFERVALRRVAALYVQDFLKL